MSNKMETKMKTYLITVYVEGITDVEIYYSYFRKCVRFKSLEDDEETEFNKFVKRLELSRGLLLPREKRRVLKKELGDKCLYVIIQAKNSENQLNNLIENIDEVGEKKQDLCKYFENLENEGTYLKVFIIFAKQTINKNINGKFILMAKIYNYKKDLLRPTKYFIIQTETNSQTFGVEFITNRNIVIHFLMSLN